MKTCPSCGFVNEDRSNFCAKCGSRLTAPAAESAATPPAAPPVEPTPPTPPAVAQDAALTPLRANARIAEDNLCGVCGARFAVGEEIFRCETCGKYYHARCREQSGGCVTPGCRTEDLKPCPFCGERIKKTAVKCRFCGQFLDQELKTTLEAGQPKGEVKEANDALIMSIIGLFCFGIILGPIAISKGTKALNIIKSDPGYTGKGKATAGIVIGIIDLVGWLAGMIIRNSVILVVQIDQDLQAGVSLWHAIVESTVRRMRPILLTALAAILAMIPLTHSVFWGPMAWAIMGGLFVATLLTLVFLPALYASWYGATRPQAAV